MKMMFKSMGVLILLLLSTLLMAACNGGAALPTLDPNVIYTEAAITVAAQLTADAPPTHTPQPTPIPTNTPLPPTNTPLPERPTETPAAAENKSTETPQATATKPSSANDLIDDTVLILFYPPDDQVYSSGGTFNAQVGFRNMGPNTWNAGYSMRYLSGNSFGVGSKYVMSEYGTKGSVAPGEEVVITIPNMTAPNDEGRYLSNWCLYNNREEQGLKPQCFYLITFQIIVRN